MATFAVQAHAVRCYGGEMLLAIADQAGNENRAGLQH